MLDGKLKSEKCKIKWKLLLFQFFSILKLDQSIDQSSSLSHSHSMDFD
jgi:hypothetical protein